MKFFIPYVENPEEAEKVYLAIAEFNKADVKSNRIYSLSWHHKGQSMSCAVGKPLPTYYGTDSEPVLAILDGRNHFIICTKSRGGVHGEAVLASKDYRSRITHFSKEA